MTPTNKPGSPNRQRPIGGGAEVPDELSVMEPTQQAEVLGPVDAPPQRQLKRSWRRAGSVGLLSFGLIAGLLVVMHGVSVNKKQAALKAAQSEQSMQIKAQSIGLTRLGLTPIDSLKQQVGTLTVNGQVDVTNSVVLEPTTVPQGAVAGQLYFDQSRNQLGYYNGGTFYYLQGGTAAGNNVTNVSNVYNVNNVSNVTNISNFTNAATGPPGVIPMFDGSGLTDSILNQNGSGVAVGATANTNTRFTVSGATSDSSTSALTVTDSSGNVYGQIADDGTVNLGKGPGAVLGNNVVFPTSDTGSTGIISADKFVTTTATKVVSMSIYIGGASSFPNNKYQLAIYTDIAGVPGALVATSGVGTLTGNTWNTLPISASLAGGTAYWLAYTNNNTSGFLDNPYYESTGSNTHAWVTFTFGSGSQNGWPATFPPPNNINHFTHTIYATSAGTGAAITLHADGSLSDNGAATFKETNNDTNAFQVQNSSGFDVLNVDTAGGNVGVGTGAPSARLSVVGATNNSTTSALSIKNSSGTSLALIGDDGQVSLGTGAGSSLGYSGIGSDPYDASGNPYGVGQNTIIAQKVTTTSGGKIASISGYIGAGGIELAPNNKFQFAIYADNAGTPGNYVASTTVNSIGAAGWYTEPITATLAANTTYWLVYSQNDPNNDSNNGISANTGVSGAVQVQNSYTWQSGPDNGLPAAFPTAGSVTNAGARASLYATFSSANPALTISSSGTMTQAGAAVFQDPTDSPTAYQFQDSGSSTVLDVDTLDGNVGVGTTAPSNGRLSIVGATNDSTSTALDVRSSASTSLLQVKDDGSVNLGESHAVFGSSSSGDYTGSGYFNGSAQLLQAQSFTTTSGGTISSMSTYIGQGIAASPNNQYQMAIYADNAGAPGAYIASTAVGTLTGGGWNTLPITATLSASTKYWLVYWTNTNDGSHNGQNFISGYSGPNKFYQAFVTWQSGASNGMPTTFPGGGTASGGYETSIYASFATPVSAVSLDTSGNITSNGNLMIQNNSSASLLVADASGGTALYVDGGSHEVGINVNNTGGYNLNVSGTTALGDVASSNAFRVFDGSFSPVLAVDTSNASGSVVTVEAGASGTYATLALSNAHFSSTQTTAPTIATPINCGTSPTAMITAGSTDTAGSFTITTGSGTPTTCDSVITFNKAYSSAPKSIMLTPTIAVGGATLSMGARVSAVSTTTVTAQIDTPAAATTYSYYYWVVQ